MKLLQPFQRQFFRLAALGVLSSTLFCHPTPGQGQSPPVQGQSPPVQAVEPIRGMVGVGTWATQAEFRDIKVTKGNQTL
jgi:hydrogenase/urease accessory protein HupE